MNHHSNTGLIQQWALVTGADGAQLLVARWASDSARSDAAGIA